MKNAIRWILIIIGLLIIVGVATAVLPSILNGTGGEGGPILETTNEPLTIMLGGYLLGEELAKVEQIKDAVDGQLVDPMMFAGLLAGILVVAVIAVAIVLGIVMRMTDRATTNNRNDERYQQGSEVLQQREKDENKELAKSQPPSKVPSHSHPRWDVVSTAFVILMFAAFAGVMVAETLRPDLQVEFLGLLVPSSTVAMLTVVLITAIILVFTLKPKRLAAVDDTDYQAVNWSMVWVLLSGLILLGIGTGVMVAIRSAGG